MDRSRNGQPRSAASPTSPASVVKTVVLQIALNPGQAAVAGKPVEGYVLTAPLDKDGYLDVGGRKAQRWPVRRFGDPEDGETGWLSHRGSAWFIDYDDDTTQDDEAIFRLSDHRFAVGEYLTVTNASGKSLTYRVAQVEPVG